MLGERVLPVAKVLLWHNAHPTLVNTVLPFLAEALSVAGVGGARKRINTEKFTISEDMSPAVPVLPPFSAVSLVPSSGDALNTQPVTADLSLGNPSFETPCSTL